METPTAPTGRLLGHESDVLCCASVSLQRLIASGSEVGMSSAYKRPQMPALSGGVQTASCLFAFQDGVIGLHDTRSHEMVQTINLAETGAVEIPSIVSTAEDDNQLIACAADCAFQVDLRQVGLSHSAP